MAFHNVSCYAINNLFGRIIDSKYSNEWQSGQLERSVSSAIENGIKHGDKLLPSVKNNNYKPNMTYLMIIDKNDIRYLDFQRDLHAFASKLEAYKKDDYKSFYEEFC